MFLKVRSRKKKTFILNQRTVEEELCVFLVCLNSNAMLTKRSLEKQRRDGGKAIVFCMRGFESMNS